MPPLVKSFTPGAGKGNDLGEVAKLGVWLAKAGIGAVASAYEYAPFDRRCPRPRHDHDRAHRLRSIPGSGAITVSGDHLLALRPHVSFHCPPRAERGTSPAPPL